MMINKRTCIFPKDVEVITGRGDRQSRRIIEKIKKENNKQKHQLVTVIEFCNYMGLDIDTVLPFIK